MALPGARARRRGRGGVGRSSAGPGRDGQLGWRHARRTAISSATCAGQRALTARRRRTAPRRARARARDRRDDHPDAARLPLAACSPTARSAPTPGVRPGSSILSSADVSRRRCATLRGSRRPASSHLRRATKARLLIDLRAAGQPGHVCDRPRRSGAGRRQPHQCPKPLPAADQRLRCRADASQDRRDPPRQDLLT